MRRSRGGSVTFGRRKFPIDGCAAETEPGELQAHLGYKTRRESEQYQGLYESHHRILLRTGQYTKRAEKWTDTNYRNPRTPKRSIISFQKTSTRLTQYP
ncbi:hypothetical protein PILCRDRAFT_819802 [Piloderma croceum F 1598]|uniref:Uncharacterized protein n=1 Tax=Piloderma croceum (strain F 1598) TaxID=765440 RepID=A0A0C3FEU5_PILCF|nr:hypothetical protein PILCRDRAFT_819802 [Piloderma croceum F 1598]